MPQRRQRERAVVGEPDGGVAHARSGPASGTPGRPGSGPGPACCARTRRAAAGSRRWRDQRRRDERRLPRLVAAAVDDLDDRPAGPLLVDRRAHQPVADRGQPGHGRARRHQQHRHAGPPGPLDGDVAGVPRRAALLLQRLVVLVEDDDRGEVGARRPRRRPRPDHDVDAGRRRAPTPAGTGRRSSPARRSRVASSRAWSTRRHDDQRRPAADRGQHHRQRRRRPAAAAAPRRRRPAARPRRRGSGSAPARCGAAGGSPATLVGGLAVTRNGRSRPARPAHDAHRASSISSARRAERRTTLASGTQPVDVDGDRRRIRRATTQPPTRRPCSGTRTIDPTRDVAASSSGTR